MEEEGDAARLATAYKQLDLDKSNHFKLEVISFREGDRAASRNYTRKQSEIPTITWKPLSIRFLFSSLIRQISASILAATERKCRKKN